MTSDEWMNFGGETTDDNYSILNELDDSKRGADGKFTFMMVWPNMEGVNT